VGKKNTSNQAVSFTVKENVRPCGNCHAIINSLLFVIRTRPHLIVMPQIPDPLKVTAHPLKFRGVSGLP
jgi:hypothetical protein